MIRPEALTRISGPPGTGKSTALLNVVDSLLSSGVAPDEIIYTTFTRAGAYEARDRACARFRLSPESLPYFRTLHSLCHGLLPSRQVMQIKDWGVIARTLGVYFSVRVQPDDAQIPHGYTRGDSLLTLWALMRVCRKPMQQVLLEQETWIKGDRPVEEAELRHFIESVTNYKREYGKIDFTDMLEDWLRDGADLKCDYLIVDEAQDLSPLQWEIVAKLGRHAKKAWIAGDDDQCIHAWNGASTKHFIELLASEDVVLPQSYRIPATVHAKAHEIVNRISHRVQKTYRPRDEPGAVTEIDDLHKLDLSTGSWFLLARNSAHLPDYVQLCKDRGVAFRHILKTADESKFRAAALDWCALTAGKSINRGAAEVLISMISKQNIMWGAKAEFSRLDAKYTEITHALLKEMFGLKPGPEVHWSKALDLIPEDIALSMKKAEEVEGLTAQPRILISTIHGVKGMEADHVVIRNDMQMPTFVGFQRRPDDEHRAFYVAVTRAKKSLWILRSWNDRTYPL